MDQDLVELYRQIKSGEITHERAAKQIQEIVRSKQAQMGKFAAEPDRADMSGSGPALQTAGEEQLHIQAVNFMKELLSSVLKLPAERIDAEAPLDVYGIDSVMIMELTEKLEQQFGPLSKTLFFEYKTIQELTCYMWKVHRQAFWHLLVQDRESAVPDGQETEQIKSESKPTWANSLRNLPQRRGRMDGSGKQPAVAKEPEALDIAIIGLAGRYPGARNVQQFWEQLSQGKDCITEIPASRWDHSLYFDEEKNKPGRTYSKWGGFLDGVDEFDPLFFHISPLEAEGMDPQERLFLECVYEAMEDAGYARRMSESKGEGLGKDGAVGVYVGVMYEEYQLYGAQEQMLGHNVALGGNSSSIANRVSYFFNFHGPSLALNTMCSSSLTAIHLACQSLQRGECSAAIAGGVNVSIHPNKYLLLGQGSFVSSKGRCESFGEGGDGYVPGEGVGAVLLKPINQAMADGDHIYGVIKGTAINHGGKTNGYTVPNPNAQADVIRQAVQKAKIDPRAISYIEAHGTGTSLGDPIEIAGLTKALEGSTQDKNYCSIGSVKSNIGHCESAAGIAGITKILLQMKHRQLVPSLHAGKLNKHIDFENSPFVVQQKLEAWKRPVVGQREYPRIAGISSFGAGGANAHIIIAEHIPSEEPAYPHLNPDQPVIVVLSAPNQERLQEKARQLLAFITEQGLSEQHLVSMAYTLQAGREEFKERLALTTSSIRELKDKLRAYLSGEKEINNLRQGQIKPPHEVPLQGEDGDIEQVIENWLKEGTYARLLELWVSGGTVDWSRRYNSTKVKRMSLPTYPFERKRYWLEQTKSMPAAAVIASEAKLLHPLVHTNVSNLAEQRFRSTFTGREFFAAGHTVQGRQLLPGTVCLEMIRAAVVQATEGVEPTGSALQLKNVTWTRPIELGEGPVDIQIGVHPLENGEIGCTLTSSSPYPDAELTVHSQGTAVLLASLPEVPRLHLQALQAECSEAYISADECYELYRRMGMNYGEGQQGLEFIHVGQERVLARLKLPVSALNGLDSWVLHPSMLDAAIQAGLGLRVIPSSVQTSSGTAEAMFTPFALEELTIYGSCQPEMWASIRYSEGSSNREQVEKLDLDLCDEQGRICVRMKGFSMIRREENSSSSCYPNPSGTLLQQPIWDVVSPANFSSDSPYPTQRVLLVGGTAEQRSAIKLSSLELLELSVQPDAVVEEIAAQLAGLPEVKHIIWIVPHSVPATCVADAVIQSQQEGLLLLFRWVKSLLSLGFGSRELYWTIVTTGAQQVHPQEVVDPTHAGIHGFVGSMAKECTEWKIRLIDLEPDADLSYGQIAAIPPDPQGNAWAMRHRQWYRQKLLTVNGIPSASPGMYRENGVYVVIGGAGGIGEAWSEYMLRRCQAQIVWIGRRALDDSIREKLDRLSQMGLAPHYIAADASSYEDLQVAYEEIKQKYGQIHGVIHSAVGDMDQSLVQMDESRFRAGLSAKIDVSVRMAQVFAREHLDFVLFFSSIGSFGKLLGQSSYAAGCTFADAFAIRLQKEWSASVKVMNWGYWGDIGIGSDIPQTFKNRMAQSGIGFIELEDAMVALEALQSGPIDQLSMIQLDPSRAHHHTDVEEWIEIFPQQRERFGSDIRRSIPLASQQVKRLLAQSTPLREQLDQLLCRLLWSELQRSEILRNPDRLLDMYTRWFNESMAILERHGFLENTERGDSASERELDFAWQDWQAQKERWPQETDLEAQLSLVEVALQALPDILTGRRSAVEILFPNSSIERVEKIYKNNEAADLFNEVLADTIIACIQEQLRHDPGARIRILEIGAGTGGTSAVVLEKLKPFRAHIEEYAYTDLSKAFLMHAHKEYGPDHPYLTTQVLNVEQSLFEQPVPTDRFDLVIAANVLHATKDIRQTIRNVKAALKSSGWIVMNELSSHSLFTHLTFGLLEGWWLYEDAEIRLPGGPGVSPAGWKAILEQEGFGEVFYPALEAHGLGQQIIAASSDGRVRRRKHRSEPSTPISARPVLHVRQQSKQQTVLQDVLHERSLGYFKKLVGDTLKIPLQQIDPAEPLENYGIDSILVVQLTNTLRKAFGEVSSTLFFEHQTLDAVVSHFMETRKEELMTLLGLEPNPSETHHTDHAEPQAVRSTPLSVGLQSSRLIQVKEPVIGDSSLSREGIAIIGISGRYPQANNLTAYWDQIQKGTDCITEIPADRWAMDELFEADPKKAMEAGKSYSKWGGFIDGFAEFDPLFFNISPREALSMDPQERLFIMSCWEVMEDAGYTRERLTKQFNRQVGVFAGITKTGFELCGSEEWKRDERIYPHTSFGSVANRVSYLLNLQGPSMPIDTMCSSSLTAVHEACEHLYRQECEMAIAGGVNLYMHPSSYIGLSAQQMLSADGRCKSFGLGGNGFVPGEGVGTVLLKPLSRAIADQDHIYAVIRATAINHGGKTNGYTVPNPTAQGELIRKTLDKAGIHARTVSYIEAHGTGTELGDPIEITGLTQAFTKDTQDKGYCSIGSVKSNIGHLEAAAGIAGLTKIVLQMKHQKLVPTLHAEQLNPNIDFAKTPFTVQRKLEEWKRPLISLHGAVREYPRTAGISSFGAGGANAHVVIEEYIPLTEDGPAASFSPQQPTLIVLSAKNEGRLREQVLRLHAYLEQQQLPDTVLPDLAYTLQTGREAMEERWALIVHSMQELKEKLRAFTEDQNSSEFGYRGQVKPNKETIALFGDEEMQAAIARWVEQKKYAKLLDLWVKGLALDWERFYGEAQPRRMPLPTYAFARDRYWMPTEQADMRSIATVAATECRLHPLLHRNTSDLTEQRYSSSFTGEEFFLRDHRINGSRILPGVAYLEMARTAVLDALGSGRPNSNSDEHCRTTTGVQLRNIVWRQPILVDEGKADVNIALYPEERGEIAFDIYSLPRGNQSEAIIHCQGVAAANGSGPQPQPTVNLAHLQQACQDGLIAPGPLYEAFHQIGIDYGSGHRAIEAVYMGNDQMLAKLALPSLLRGSEQAYVLHPSLMDSALQAPLAYFLHSLDAGDEEAAPLKPTLPYALQKLEVIRSCTDSMWAWIRHSQGSKPGDKLQKLDVDLLNPAGEICVQMRGYTSRVLDGEQNRAVADDPAVTLLFEQGWEEQPTVPAMQASYEQHVVFLCEQHSNLRDKLAQQMTEASFIPLDSEKNHFAEDFEGHAARMLLHLQAILNKGTGGKVLIQLAGSSHPEHRLWTGLYGLLQTAQMENPKIVSQLIEVEPEADAAVWEMRLQENYAFPLVGRVQYRQGKRRVEVWKEIQTTDSPPISPWKDRGIYIITGGAGHLGLIFAAEMLRDVQGATVILTGRSSLSADLHAKLQELASSRNQIQYEQVDASDREAAVALVNRIVRKYGRVDGIIHSAGLIDDQYLHLKTEEQLREVMAPKVSGLIHMDEATRGLPLDFFMIFSSLAAVKGNAGQGDYAAANAFMDVYAEYRESLVAQGMCQGRTLSVNWPLWEDGGMQVPFQTRKWMENNLGIVPLPTLPGIQALLQGFAAQKSRVAVVHGRPAIIRQKLFQVNPAEVKPLTMAASVPSIPSAGNNDSLMDKLLATLTAALSKLLKVNIEEIHIHTELSEYGCDSISFTQFANDLNRDFKFELAPTVFFEYETLASLATYLLEKHGSLIQNRFAKPVADRRVSETIGEEEILKSSTEGMNAPATLSMNTRRGRRFVQHSEAATASEKPPAGDADEDAIAIVGVSACFPMARNLDEYWDNLAAGRDCIQEIPGDRWDWRSIYGDPMKEENKTNIKWSGFIDGVNQFDPLFFGISPREAELMDPQQRLLMTHVWKVIEDAGISPQDLSGTKTGIFVGTSFSGYSSLISKAQLPVDSYSSTGLVPSVGPNRMSYFLNIHGPSEPIETACSSSLVAIVRAVNAIENGSCEMAIVGGVNTIVTPDGHISFNKAGMLAPDGRCKTFSAQANGYVRSEGAGMLFLKKLSAAERDSNIIYGLIRGAAENHGGRATSLTAPNPKAQTELLKTAYTQSGIDPATVTYIETHGTGTELGDPIEINALKSAFQALHERAGHSPVVQPYCGLGSVKSNIGHAELAAGIAGVIKVLLQLKHRTLVKSLHCETVNPYIQLEDSPFYIVQEKHAWEAVRDSDDRELPRRAGVSSFGFGGSNAHVVLEEYVPKHPVHRTPKVTSDRPAMIVLSAKNKERLQEQAKQQLAFVQNKNNGIDDAVLADVAYTLQIGREAMEERLAMTVTSVSELERKLQAFVQGSEGHGMFYHGQAQRIQKLTAEFGSEEEVKKSVIRWLEQHAYADLLGHWVRGVPVDWSEMYQEDKPRLISLPTYPFAEERYWVPQAKKEHSGEASKASVVLHPLLHRNTSDFSEQHFESLFTGQEFFFKDHQVNGQRMFPGTAYLEMARAAVERSLGVPNADLGSGGFPILLLKNIVWARPLTILEEAVRLHIALAPKEAGQAAFEIYSETGANNTECIVHSKGAAVWSHRAAEHTRDLSALQAACSHGEISRSRVYETFRTIGIDYGPAHQGIEALYTGREQLLAKLALPEVVAASSHEFVLHPSMLDAALQTSIGFLLSSYGDEDTPIIRPVVPFALEEIEIRGACTATMWAWVRYSEGSRPEGTLQKIDIDLMDASGETRVRLKGYTSRTLDGESQKATDEEASEPSLFAPVWTEQAAAARLEAKYDKRLVMICEPEDSPENDWKFRSSRVRFIVLQSQEREAADRFKTYAAWMLEELQSLLKAPSAQKILIQLVFSTKKEQQLFSGLFGLLQTAALENPSINVQCIGVESINKAQLTGILEENSATADTHIRYEAGSRFVGNWSAVERPGQLAVLPWKDYGVYAISGGAGGLGLILAGEIIRRVKMPVLRLAGSSPLKSEKREQISDLEKLGARVIYEQVDVTKAHAVNEWMDRIRQDHGRIDGVLHCAGVIRDHYLLQKTQDELQEVLGPKVSGVSVLDEATRNDTLDFFITFSSLAGMTGSAGQGDYAAANAFMDAYVQHRSELEIVGERHGRSLSINWPLWQDGGMQVEPDMARVMRQQTGLVPLETEVGLQSFYWCWAAEWCQIAVVTGHLGRLQSAMFRPPLPTAEHEASKLLEAAVQPDQLREKAVHLLKELLAAVIKLPANRINPRIPMEQYGIDSLMIMQLNSQLEETFGSLSKTLFFEYQTLDALSDYFLENHREQLLAMLELPQHQASVSEEAVKQDIGGESARTEKKEKISISRMPEHLLPSPRTRKEAETSSALDIAIIGVAGRYPGAEDTHQFWTNLRDGKDQITEIPRERWDYRLYYDKDKTKLGKTNGKWGGFIEGVDRFDPLFFQISPREAEIMDPQERLFLQCAFEVLEDAGYTRESLNRAYGNEYGSNVGVYVGVMYEEYQLYGAQEQTQGRPIALSGSPSSIANRVSYFCNFHGPSMAVDTMCSSSLTAIHLACSAILRGECELALAGGVNVSIHPNKYFNLGQGKFVSSKGKCESFGEGGDGYVPGEGVGALLLKPLHLAIADGDQIYGVIKGTAANHGGKTNGYTVPNPNAQADVIGKTLKEAGFDPRTISYIEAHGTGTSLGDPIEITGLTKAFQGYTKDRQFCAIGSVKSNIGHCESAAGIAGITKVLLQMKHRQLVPSLHAETLNPHIDFGRTPFVVQQKLEAWPRPQLQINGVIQEYPRRAGISAFGAGGSNVHILIEEYVPHSHEEVSQPDKNHPPALILLSAKQPERLREQAERLLYALQQQSIAENRLADAAYTLQVGREAMEERLGIEVTSVKELKLKLKAFLEGNSTMDGLYRGAGKRGQEVLLTSDEESSGADIPGLLRQRKYGEVLALWSTGALVNWELMYERGMRQRISLPTYPFARDRYWVPTMVDRTNMDYTGQPLALHTGDTGADAAAEEQITLAPETFVSVFQGMKERVKSAVKPLELPTVSWQAVEPVREDMQDQLQTALVRHLSELLEVSEQDLDIHIELEEYGFDPIKQVLLVQRLNQIYLLALTPDIFLECPTIFSLAQYLLITHTPSLTAYYRRLVKV